MDLEGTWPGRYDVVNRWSGGEITTICMDLLKLTGFEVNRAEIY